VVVSSSSVTIQGPSTRSRQTWVNRSELNSVLVARSYSQRVAISRIGACITSIARPCLPIWMVSARVTATTGIDSRMLRPSVLAPKSNHSAASILLV
jgi:hypothetical protein